MVSALSALTSEEVDLDFWKLSYPEHGSEADRIRENKSCKWNCTFHFKPIIGHLLQELLHLQRYRTNQQNSSLPLVDGRLGTEPIFVPQGRRTSYNNVTRNSKSPTTKTIYIHETSFPICQHNNSKDTWSPPVFCLFRGEQQRRCT